MKKLSTLLVLICSILSTSTLPSHAISQTNCLKNTGIHKIHKCAPHSKKSLIKGKQHYDHSKSTTNIVQKSVDPRQLDFQDPRWLSWVNDCVRNGSPAILPFRKGFTNDGPTKIWKDLLNEHNGV